MINIKLIELAERLNKSITDIAKETGINRNTITALYHNKVNGIKFETLNTLCNTYKINLGDLLEFSPEKMEAGSTFEDVYRQEGSLVLFTAWPWMMASNNLNSKFFKFDFKKIWLYEKDDYIFVWWLKDQMMKLADYAYKLFSQEKNLTELFNDFETKAAVIKNIYFQAKPEMIINMSSPDLIKYYNKLWRAYADFWGDSLFIDAFDAGYDVQKIKQIARSYNFTDQEIEILSTATQKTFNRQRELMLLKIVKIVIEKEIPASQLNSFLKDFVKNNVEVEQYIKNFDYYKSNYAQVEHINQQEIIDEIKRFLKEPELFTTEYEALKNYENNIKIQIDKNLQKYKIKDNPLAFFGLLTYWREYRKQINLMGIHVCELVLQSLEQKTGIPLKYIKYLAYDEISHVLKGSVDLELLKRRRDDGCMVIVSNKDYKILPGNEAESIRNEFDKQTLKHGENNVIFGQVACQGYAKGIAKIILSTKDFGKFNQGDILVSGMTRPEFLPVMKKAAGIVTNDGGITCHAAIVARELGIPCIIGTGNATQLIKDGDLVEVRANHGTVRILS